MHPAEYSQLALTTAANLGWRGNIYHSGLGLVSEAGEFADWVKKSLAYGRPFDKVEAAAELGDLLWFLALLAKQIDTPFESLMPTQPLTTEPVDQLALDLACYASMVAASSRNCVDHALNPHYIYEMKRLVITIDKAARAMGFTLQELMQMNIAKLARRYPEGFSEWRANNRDLVEERKVLEGGTQQP